MRLLPSLLIFAGCEGVLGSTKDSDSSDTGAAGDDDDDDDDDDTTGDDDDTTVEDDLDCDADYDTPAPGGVGSCVTEEVHCGDVIYGTIDGGSDIYDYDYWLSLGALDSLLFEYEALDGNERSYYFSDTDVETTVRATFHTCFDLWANWILRGDTCDTENTATGGVFEGGTGQQWYTERLNPGGQNQYEFIVEGLYGATGNYALTIECF